MTQKGDVNLSISGDDAGLVAALQQAGAAVSENAARMKESMQGVGDGFESIKAGFVGLAAIMAGGEIGQQLNEVADRAEQIRLSASNFNITTTALQGLQVVAAQTGVSSETLNSAMTRLRSQMTQAAETGGSAAERFESLGITLQQMRDPSFSVVDAMAKMGAASNSNAALMGELGDRGSELIPMLRELATNHNLVADSAQKVGALTGDEINTLQAYKDSVEVADISWQNLTARLLGQAAPALEYTTNALTGLVQPADAAANSLTPLQTVIEGIGDGFIVFTAAVRDYTDIVAAWITSQIALWEGLAEAIWDALHGRFSKAKDDAIEIGHEIAANWRTMFDSFNQNAKTAENSWTSFNAAVSAKPVAVPQIPAMQATPLVDLSHTKTLADQMDQEFQQLGEKLQSTMERTQQQITASTASGITARESLETAGIDRQIAGVQSAYRSGQISAEQDLQQTQALLTQKWAAQEDYSEKVRTLYAGNQAELDRLDAQEGKDHSTYLAKMQSAQDSYSAKVTQSWQSVASSISNEMTRAFTGVLQGTESLSQATQRMFANMAESIITTLVKMEATKMVMHALGIQQNKEEEKSNAAVAASGAAKSAAQIPYVGWLLAPVAAAATYAMASGFSAKEGFDIPAGLNPKVQLHEREMVLPSQYADVIRGMAGGDGGGGDTHHWHIHAADASSFADMLDRNEGGFREKLAAAVRGRPVWGH